MDEEKQELREESRGLTFKDILFILRKHWIAIIAFLMVGIAGGAVWAGLEVKAFPVYQSSGIIMVSPEGSTSSQTAAQDYTLSNNLTNTVVAFIKTNAVLDPVRDANKSFKRSNLSVSNSSGNLMITVKYTSKDPEESRKMCQAVMDAAVAEADSEKEDGTKKYHMLHNNLNVVDDAKQGSRVWHPLRDTAAGFAAGIAIALIYVFIREISDNTFKSSEEIERSLGIPALAGIPDYHFDDEKKGGK